jgi:hypothetical protein
MGMLIKKWTRLFYLCLMLGSLHVLAEEAPDAFVWTSGSIEGARALFGPQANVEILSREVEERRERKAGYLPPDQRDVVFRKVGIETKISNMDEFDKDMLMMGAGAYPLSVLKKEYPMLSETQLKRLQAEMKKVK